MLALVPFFSGSRMSKSPPAAQTAAKSSTHGSFLIRRQRGHPGAVLPLVISNRQEGMQLESSPIRSEPKQKLNQIGNEPCVCRIFVASAFTVLVGCREGRSACQDMNPIGKMYVQAKCVVTVCWSYERLRKYENTTWQYMQSHNSYKHNN